MDKNELKALDVDVINFILLNNTATIEDLCNCFEVSQVNIRNVLAKIEDFVKEKNLGVLCKENSEYFFENNSLNLDFDYLQYQTKNIEKSERIVYILFKLVFEKSINLSKISRELDVSRVTLNGDIEAIKDFISSFGLNLVSVQWKGIFLEGTPCKLQKFSMLFITKLYLEGYFESNLKKIVNPLVFNHFRKFIDEETEEKLTNLTNKFYSYFNIQLGSNYYFMLKALIVFIHHESRRSNESTLVCENPAVDVTEKIYNILTKSEKDLLGDNTVLLATYFSQCMYEKYIPIYAFDMNKLLKDFFDEFNLYVLKESEDVANELAVFINNSYFMGRFYLPAYVKLNETDVKKLEKSTAKSIMRIFDKHKIPYKNHDIIFLYYYIKELITESKKQNVLIVDNGSLKWKGKILKDKIKHLDSINEIDIISYFNFKFYFEKLYNKEKYKTYIFIDTPFEKSNDFGNKNCIFINGYDLMTNNLDLNTLFNIGEPQL